jgi:hypothetical protein
MCVEKKTRLTRGETRLGFIYDRLMCRRAALGASLLEPSRRCLGATLLRGTLGGGLPVSGLASRAHGGTIKRIRSLTVPFYRPELDCANGWLLQLVGWMSR